MRWWVHSSLSRKIFVAFAALIIAVLVSTLGFTQLVVRRESQQTLSRELRTTGQVFERLLEERAIRLRTNSVLLASDFALKRIIATHFDAANYDPATLASASMSYQQRIGVQLLWMTDESGALLSASPESGRPGQSFAEFAPLKQALATEQAASTVAEVDGALFQLVAVPVFGPDVIGFLLLGQLIDDDLAARLQRDTGSDISFMTASHIFASSWPAERRKRLLKSGVFQIAARTQDDPAILAVGGERFLSMVVSIDASVSQPLFAVVQGSYDRALAPLHALQLRIAAIGAVAIAIALLVGSGLAAGIIRPVRTLVEGTREVLRGNLNYRTRIDRQDEIGFLARSFNEMVDGLNEREHIKNTFGRFVSRDVAEAVLAGRVPLEGESREVSILFQDIRGFTALSRRLEPSALLRMLNRFFTEVVAAVELNGGVVKQFTGDGVMALFGAPQIRVDHAQCAVRAALEIVSRLGRLNVLLNRDGSPMLQIGVGVHTGTVVAGLIGPDERVEYGVVGEPVNLASRVEALTKEVRATILVSKEIAMRLGPEFSLGRAVALPVKGKLEPMEVQEVLVPPHELSA